MTKSQTLSEDLESVAQRGLPVEKYRDRTFLVTGATGLVGSLVVRNLLHLNRRFALGLHVTAVVRRIEKAYAVYEAERDDPALSFVVWDVAEPPPESVGPVDFVVHAASVTASREMTERPVETIRTAVGGTANVLALARDSGASGVVYLSSMEVYGTLPDADGPVAEDRLGFIDLSSPRSSYPEGKRMCECLCTACAAEYHMRVSVVRLAQTFGAGVLPGEGRVFAQFARSVIDGRDIVLRTAGLSEGNYVYAADAVAAILLLLTEGEPGAAYNAANEESHMRIRDMAALVADRVAEGRVRVVYDIPDDPASTGYAPDVKLFLSSARLRSLGWTPRVGLEEAYRRMIAYMRETEAASSGSGPFS